MSTGNLARILQAVFVFTVWTVDAYALKYHWKSSLEGSITRCFLAKEISVSCDAKGEPEQEFEIKVSSSGKRYWYGYMRAIGGSLCQQHLHAIRRLMKNADQACVTGWGETVLDGEITYHWDGFETKLGEVHP